jgi:hypothetical protein
MARVPTSTSAAAAIRKTAPSTRAAAQPTSQPVFVDVSERSVSADVVRDGYRVPTAKVDRARADFLISDLVEIGKRDEPRVISQSVPAGTAVSAGTVVNLVLTSRSNVPLDIFDGVHRELSQRNIDELLEGTLADATIRQNFLRYEQAAEVPAEVRAQLTTALMQNEITIDDSQPDRSFESAFNTARAALAFR